MATLDVGIAVGTLGRMADTQLRRFRADDDLWDRFKSAVDRSPDPEADMSKILRQFCRWYAGVPGAGLPERPESTEGAAK